MTATVPPRFADLAFELRFDPLVDAQAPLSFPCDARGQIDLDELCDRSRSDYLFAHTLIGRRFTSPSSAPARSESVLGVGAARRAPGLHALDHLAREEA